MSRDENEAKGTPAAREAKLALALRANLRRRKTGAVPKPPGAGAVAPHKRD
jgi:hypothetical protein